MVRAPSRAYEYQLCVIEVLDAVRGGCGQYSALTGKEEGGPEERMRTTIICGEKGAALLADIESRSHREIVNENRT